MPGGCPEKEPKIDDLDRKIIEILRSDGRASFRSIASKVGLSSVAVRERINKLLKENVIKGFFAHIDASKIGRGTSAIFDVIAEPSMIEKVGAEIAKFDEVVRVYERMSGSELHVHALFRNQKEMEDFIKDKLYKIPGIVNVKASLVLRRYKIDPSLSI